MSFHPNRFRATRALNAAEWFRLGFLMDFAPPFTFVPGTESTYTLSEKRSQLWIRFTDAERADSLERRKHSDARS